MKDPIFYSHTFHLSNALSSIAFGQLGASFIASLRAFETTIRSTKTLSTTCLVLTLVLSFAYPLAASAVTSIDQQIKAKQSLLEQTNTQLNQIRNDIASLESQLKSNQNNADQARKTIIEERQATRLRLLDIKKATQKKSHELTAIQSEIIRADTRRKVITNANEVKRVNAEIADIERRKELVTKELLDMQAKLRAAELETQGFNVKDDAALTGFSQEQQKLITKLLAAKNSVYIFKKKINSVKNDLAAMQKVNSNSARKTAQNNPVKPIERTQAQTLPPQQLVNAKLATPSKPKVASSNAYVYVISGADDPDIEASLRLRNWVESYGAKYIEGQWNNLHSKRPGNKKGNINEFTQQMESELQHIPRSAKLIMIGHGLGGGAVIKAATEAAAKLKRKVDFLVALDPVGQGNLRANIVFDTEQELCELPQGDSSSNKRYADCIKHAKPRAITANVLNFYNRWQKDSQVPLDYQKELVLSTAPGEITKTTTATGKFRIASRSTMSNQKREYYRGDDDAHHKILTDAASQLPNLLIEYIQ